MKESVVPSCVFVPSTDLLRKMIMAVARCHSTQEMREMFNAYWEKLIVNVCFKNLL